MVTFWELKRLIFVTVKGFFRCYARSVLYRLIWPGDPRSILYGRVIWPGDPRSIRLIFLEDPRSIRIIFPGGPDSICRAPNILVLLGDPGFIDRASGIKVLPCVGPIQSVGSCASSCAP